MTPHEYRAKWNRTTAKGFFFGGARRAIYEPPRLAAASPAASPLSPAGPSAFFTRSRRLLFLNNSTKGVDGGGGGGGGGGSGHAFRARNEDVCCFFACIGRRFECGSLWVFGFYRFWFVSAWPVFSIWTKLGSFDLVSESGSCSRSLSLARSCLSRAALVFTRFSFCLELQAFHDGGHLRLTWLSWPCWNRIILVCVPVHATTARVLTFSFRLPSFNFSPVCGCAPFRRPIRERHRRGCTIWHRVLFATRFGRVKWPLFVIVTVRSSVKNQWNTVQAPEFESNRWYQPSKIRCN